MAFLQPGICPCRRNGIMPEVMMVDGKVIAQEDANAPAWQTALAKNKPTAHGVIRRLPAASRLPQLLRRHIRLIIRPKGGLDVKKVSLILLAKALETAAKLSPEETMKDIVCPDITQSIVVVAAPASRNAGAYAALRLVRLESNEYHISAYTAVSEGTCWLVGWFLNTLAQPT
ncbi:hypothetical protein HPB51_026932 [Rhipicephalus microplus]|uniref:Uncharacterized protein n=1 Tax=Rhipicephalus microplus TaxID=6941 RepID=A0A9J6D1Q6_RHIMP|nr:hypothetical protein HPB51_026932 [Rhipicephalus microplus]